LQLLLIELLQRPIEFTQYLSMRYTARLADSGIAPSVTWVDWFNTRRLLEPIGYVPPAEFEARYYEQAAVA